MKLKDYIQIFAAVLILLGFVLFWLFQTQKNADQKHFAANYSYVGVIDNDADSKISADSILSGADAILALDPTWQGPIVNIFSLDSNKDGLINILDPAYSHLGLLIYGEKYIFSPLDKAGIRAIKLSNSDGRKNYQAIFPDSSQRAVRAK